MGGRQTKAATAIKQAYGALVSKYNDPNNDRKTDNYNKQLQSLLDITSIDDVAENLLKSNSQFKNMLIEDYLTQTLLKYELLYDNPDRDNIISDLKNYSNRLQILIDKFKDHTPTQHSRDRINSYLMTHYISKDDKYQNVKIRL